MKTDRIKETVVYGIRYIYRILVNGVFVVYGSLVDRGNTLFNLDEKTCQYQKVALTHTVYRVRQYDKGGLV